MIFLELNDWQLTAWNELGDCLLQQTAGASSAEGRLVFAGQANRYSRSHPQQFNNKYLYSLAADPLAGDLRPAKNHADLIYHHLLGLDLPQGQPIALCVGGQLTNQQLGLLLGICREAGLRVTGFIDAALAQSLAIPASGDFHVLDAELHRLTLTHISVSPGHREVVQTTAFDGAGVAGIIDGWMNVIADEFVQKTRFDPLHAGATEQQLFDQVSAWLDAADIRDRRVTVSNGDTSRDIEVSAALLTEKLRQRLAPFDFAHIQRLVLSPKAARIPGLHSLLKQQVAYIEVAENESLIDSCRLLADGLSEQDVRRIVRADITAASADRTQKLPPRERATHLLLLHTAYALSNPRFDGYLDAPEACVLPTGSADDTGTIPLNPGDVIEIAGQEYLAIRLE